MEIFIAVGLIFLAIILGLTFVVYWIPKKIGYPKIGRILATVVGLLATIAITYTIFEDQFFFKKDARKFLAEQDIYLTDNFEITENKSMSGIGDYYHKFVLDISEQDKKRIIEHIRKSENFKHANENVTDITNLTDRYFGKKLTQNYESQGYFVREYFEPSGKQNYAPTYRKIQIDKTESKLTFEDIDE
jgi:hypothetical protein